MKSAFPVLTNPINKHPAASVVPLWEDGMIGGVEKAQHWAGGQTVADLRTVLSPSLVVQ